jgi:hypothetical protein
LSIDLLAIARKEGCRISLGTDSHGASQLRYIDLGIAATIRAKVDPKRILNLMSTDKLLQWAAGVREQSLRAGLPYELAYWAFTLARPPAGF